SNIVFFGATRATVTNATENSLTVTVPVGATYQPISVLNSSTLLTGYSASPFVTTFSPNNSNISKTFFSSQLDLSPASSSFAEYMTTGDIDGDGKADVVSVNSDVAGSNVSIFRNISNSGAASFDAKIELQFGGAPTGIVVRDLNGDGKPEVIALDAAKVSIFGNTSSSGNISFAPKVDLTITNGGSITVGDLDNDGKPDVVVCIRQSKIVSVFRNTSTNGTLSFANAIVAVTLSANSPENTTIGDFDSDGKADLAVVNKATATVSVFRNISTPGNIAFGTALVLTAGDKPESSAIGDFDGDGKPDIAVANSKSNTVHVFQNTTSGNTISFTAKVDFAADAKVRNIAAADIDGDGKVDIVTAVLSIGTASVFRNTHTSGSISAASFAAKKLINAKLQDVNVTDFDGDGRPDIAGTNIKVVTVLRYSPFITQINDSFNGQVLPSIDSAVSAEVVTSASNYRFRITDGDNVQTIDAETNSFKFTQLGSYESSTSYTIDVKVEVAGMWMDYGVTSVVTTPFPVTQISETFSGKTLLNTDSVITADPVPTATGYRLRVTKDATVQTLDAPTNEFKLKELGNYDYNTTYSLDVAVKKGASVGSFGAASLLSTPAAPITQVAAQYCGATLTDVDGFIRCDVPALATAYHFRVRQGDSVRVIDELVPSTLLYKSGFYKYGTTYTVDVSVYVEGTWSEYGATCNVTSMSNPITQVAALYCGKTLTTLLGEFHADGIPTATTYRFKISNGSNEVIKDKETRLYRLNEISFYTYNTTYSIAVSANVEGNWTPYGASCNVTTTTPVTYLKQNLCGTVLNTFGNITAEWVPTATDYRFRITKNGITEYLESTGTSVNMSDMPGYEYNATYSIDIAPKVAGVWYDYGPACNVTTPAPVTRVSASSCGAILKDVDGFIRAEAFPKAIGYRFRVRQGSNEGEILEAGPTTLLYKTNFYTYGTVYTVDVSANVDGIWTDYGPACDITSKLLPSTQLALNVCGTVLNNNGAIHADNAPTATAYRFRINGNNMQTFDSPNTNATLANKPGYAFNTTYSIDVAAQVNNVWSDYGVACNVTTIAPLTNADLSALTISTGTLSPLFAAATLDYTASVSNATAAITLRPTVADATATIKVNGIAVTSATSSGSIPLNVGANTITILATAQDTSIKKLYNIVVTRDKTTPVITFNTLPAKTYGAADFDPATSTNTETPVTYGSLNTAVATIVEGKIHIVGVGTSNITASQAADATHYAATDVIKQLTVVKAALTIKADNKTKAYGAALPEFTASYTGFITGEDSTYLTSPTTFISTATDQSPVSGTPYHITPQGASSNNYTITYTDGDLTITPVPLTITADDKTKVYGDPVPTLTASYTGFVNSETPADIDVLPTLSTTANAVSPVLGSPYSITAGGALDDNYTFTYVAGNLTVTGSSNAILSSLDLEGILKAKVSGANYRDYTATTSASTVKLTATA
ncbi:MAG: FG-GAP-like repeat-containing protein, partial [Pseudoxanthomonas sp.]